MVKLYTLKREMSGKVLRVDRESHTVALSLREGVLVLHGLTPAELQACGLALYQPASIEITVTPEEDGGRHDPK